MRPISGVNPDAANQQLLVSDEEDNELPASAAAGGAVVLLCSDGLVLLQLIRIASCRPSCACQGWAQAFVARSVTDMLGRVQSYI